MTEAAAITTPESLEEDHAGNPLRPRSLADFTGQPEVCKNLDVFIRAAKNRDEAIDHILLYGPPGLGKTTLAQIIASELGVGFRPTSGPIINKPGDLAAILSNLQRGDVLFIDEIHRLQIAVEEMLYSAMEDFKLDVMIGEGPAARSLRIDLQPFTLVGATTRQGLLSNPMRDRFGIPLRLRFYDKKDLQIVVERGARLLNVDISADGSAEIAARARGTPRIAIRLLKRVRDYAEAEQTLPISKEVAHDSLKRLEVDELGLDSGDRRYLHYIAHNYQGGPVGIETIAAGLSEQRDTLEDTIEPYLLQLGMLQRTPRGRMLSKKCFEHLGIPTPKNLMVDHDAV